jgi:uncharacterized membrane protein YphA (DoxX/SURF4 family)
LLQSSPLNFRRAIILLGRLVLGLIFIYAGYSKTFLPNHTFWPLFFLKFSISTNLANFALQVQAFKLLPEWGVQFVAHVLPFTEIALGLLVLIGWKLRIWGTLLTAIMLGFFVVVLRAYLLHMEINCGHVCTRGADDHFRLPGSPPPASLGPHTKTRNRINPPSCGFKFPYAISCAEGQLF